MVEMLILNYMSTHFRSLNQENIIREYFDFLDTNKNGFLAKNDLSPMLEKYKGLVSDARELYIKDIFDKLDLNQSEKIEYSEFLLANLDWELILTHKNLEITFTRFDIVHKVYFMVYIEEKGIPRALGLQKNIDRCEWSE